MGKGLCLCVGPRDLPVSVRTFIIVADVSFSYFTMIVWLSLSIGAEHCVTVKGRPANSVQVQRDLCTVAGSEPVAPPCTTQPAS